MLTSATNGGLQLVGEAAVQSVMSGVDSEDRVTEEGGNKNHDGRKREAHCE